MDIDQIKDLIQSGELTKALKVLKKNAQTPEVKKLIAECYYKKKRYVKASYYLNPNSIEYSNCVKSFNHTGSWAFFYFTIFLVVFGWWLGFDQLGCHFIWTLIGIVNLLLMLVFFIDPRLNYKFSFWVFRLMRRIKGI